MSYDVTKSRVLQWIGIIAILCLFGGAYWYFQVYGSTVNAPQNDSLTSGLVGLWSFNGDDISGTTAYDRSGSGNNGTLTNGPTKVIGKVGQALNFDGTDDYVNAGDINAIDSATALTACAWVKHDTITSDDAILSKEDVAGVNGFLLFRDDVGVISGRTDIYSFVVSDSVDTDIARVETSSNVSEVGKWAFVCGTYLANSADGLNIYVNGIQSDATVSTTGISAISGGTNLFLVGMRSDTTTMPYDGLIDETRVYDRVLSATEIQSLYALGQSDKVNSSVSQPQGTGRLDSGLAGYWKLDENTGTSAGDSSTNGNTGTLTNGPTWTTGQIGSAVSLDGTDDYISASGSQSVKTLSYWIKPTANANGGIELNANQYIYDNAIPAGWTSPTIYVDGVAKTTSYGSDIVSNGNFASNITGWTTVAGVSTVSWQNAASGDGSTGYHRFSINSNVDWDRYRHTTNIISASTTYKVSFWYRTSGITGNMKAFFTSNFDTMTNLVQSPSLVPSTSWQYVSFTMTSTSASYPVFGFFKYGSIGAGTFDVDAVSIVPVTTHNLITDTNWHHVVITTDTAITASAAKIGKGGLSYLSGFIDEVRIYSRALAADEVSQLYRLTTPTGVDTGLKGYWSFNGQDISGTTAYDRSGVGNNGTLTNGPTKVIGKVGQALNFDGTDDYVNAGTGGQILGAWTLSAWVKSPTLTTASVQTIVARAQTNNSRDYLMYFYGGGFAIQRSDGSSFPTIGSSGAYSNNVWYHVVGVFDGTTGTIYVNGTADGSGSLVATVSSNTRSLSVGAHNSSGGWGGFANGSIDEVRVYNRALSATEIQSLYTLGQSDKVNSSVSQPQGTGRLDSGLAGYWKLDENTGTSAGDSSTNSNAGTLTNGPTWTTGQIGSAVSFDGTDDYVDVGTMTSIEGKAMMSASVWVSIDSLNNGSRYPGIVGKRFPGLDGPFAIDIAASDSGDSGKIRFIVRNSSDTTVVAISNTVPSTGAWHHITGTYDGSTVRMYVDGVEQSVSASLTGVTDSVGTNMFIGKSRSSPSEYFDGKIDEVRVYNRTLSADEVSQLYRLTTPTGVDTGLKGYWSFNGQDMSGTTAYDRSGVGNTGTLTNGPTVAPGKLGQGLSFDGTDDYVDLGSSMTTFDDYATGTVSAWFKLGNSGTNPAQTILAIADKDVTTDRFEIAIGEGTASYADESASAVFAKAGAVVYAPFVRNGHTYYLDNAWHHIAVAVGANFNKIYIDGVEKSVTYLLGSATSTGFLNVNNVDVMMIGRRNLSGYGSNFSSGKIDEVRIYNRALSADEIKALYNASR